MASAPLRARPRQLLALATRCLQPDTAQPPCAITKQEPHQKGITAHQRTRGQTNSVVAVTKPRPLTHHPTEHPRLKDCDPFFLSFPYFLVVSPSFSFFLFLFLAEVRPFHGSLLIPFHKLFSFYFYLFTTLQQNGRVLQMDQANNLSDIFQRSRIPPPLHPQTKV